MSAPEEAAAAAGLKPIRWHDLRHTFASLLIAGGANVTFVSRQLGHSSSQITLNAYAHLFDGDEQAQRTRKMLQEMFGTVVDDGGSSPRLSPRVAHSTRGGSEPPGTLWSPGDTVL